MPYKRGQEWLRAAGRPSILGEGLLERARAISLALLGATAAVGLAIVALAMNQGWPLVAGSSIPVIAPRHQAVGKATVAAEMRSSDPSRVSLIDRLPFPVRPGRSGHEHRNPGLAGSPTPTDSTELVVAPSAPVRTDDDRSPGSPKSEPPPVAQQPQQASPAAPATVAEPAAVPVSQPPAAAAPPGPTTSEAPVDESDPEADGPSWSHGDGHGNDWDDDDDDDWDGGGSHDWGGHGHGRWHGHGHGD